MDIEGVKASPEQGIDTEGVKASLEQGIDHTRENRHLESVSLATVVKTYRESTE